MQPTITPLDDTASLADRAYARLRAAILAGGLEPGARLSTRLLAADLGISAQPVREAILRLEAEGLVETRPRSGSFVASLSIERLVEMGRIRAALEAAAADLAARRATPADAAMLRARLRAIQAATEAQDAAALFDANEAFHTSLHAITGNEFLIRSLHALRAYDHLGRVRVLTRAGQPDVALAEHAAILAAISNNDPAAAEAAMRAHALRSLAIAFPDA